MVGQNHLLREGSLLSRAIQSGELFSVVFWGPPGSGKTTLAKLMAAHSDMPFRLFSAVTSGVKDLREVIHEAEQTRERTARSTILFVDEIHRFNKAQQDAFLPHVESGLLILVGATTQNPSFEVIAPLLSRVRVMVLQPLDDEELRTLLTRALKDPEKGLGSFGIEMTPDAMNHLIAFSSGDARVALNNLETAVLHFSALQTSPSQPLDIAFMEETLGKKVLMADKDGEEHFNLISAFHKSLRGSDAQASLYWLYRMLMAGEDPLYIGRRMIRMATEDIGLADPNALHVALNAFESWQKIGPPEAELALAEAAVYLASAPKSNALYLAEKKVKAEIKATGSQPVPLHLRNAPTRLMKAQGYAKGYRYPHDYPSGWVRQNYLPDKVRNRIYYQPTNRGIEEKIRKRMIELKKRGG
jgi:putative ATPase